jgi:hypothetical protein
VEKIAMLPHGMHGRHVGRSVKPSMEITVKAKTWRHNNFVKNILP